MSLGICVSTSEGIVIAGESRQVNGVHRIGSDSATKVFKLTDSVIAVTAGWAFLRPQGASSARPISRLIEEFKMTITPTDTVQIIAKNLYTFFHTIYQWHVAQGFNVPVAPNQSALSFLVGGYDSLTSPIGVVFQCNIPTEVIPLRDTNNPGANWVGQFDVVSRIIKGWDPRLLSLPIAQENSQTLTQQLNGLEYVVNWSTMALQDAIDFAKSMIRVTIAVQRFTDGIQMQPGAAAGVGGPIDIIVVRSGIAAEWIVKKTLHA